MNAIVRSQGHSQDEANILIAEFAKNSKLPDDRQDYRVLTSSTAALTKEDFAQIFKALLAGQMPVRDGEEWIMAGAHQTKAGIYVALGYQCWTPHFDGARPVPRRIAANYAIAVPYEQFAAAGLGYAGLFEQLPPLETFEQDGPPLRIVPEHNLSDQLGYLANLVETLPGSSYDFAAAIAAVLLDAPVLLVSNSALKTASERLTYLDAIACLLPYGCRADLSISTGTSPAALHNVRLVLSDNNTVRDGQVKATFAVNNGLPSVERMPGARAAAYYDMLINLHKEKTTLEIMRHLAAPGMRRPIPIELRPPPGHGNGNTNPQRTNPGYGPPPLTGGAAHQRHGAGTRPAQQSDPRFTSGQQVIADPVLGILEDLDRPRLLHLKWEKGTLTLEEVRQLLSERRGDIKREYLYNFLLFVLNHPQANAADVEITSHYWGELPFEQLLNVAAKRLEKGDKASHTILVEICAVVEKMGAEYLAPLIARLVRTAATAAARVAVEDTLLLVVATPLLSLQNTPDAAQPSDRNSKIRLSWLPEVRQIWLAFARSPRLLYKFLTWVFLVYPVHTQQSLLEAMAETNEDLRKAVGLFQVAGGFTDREVHEAELALLVSTNPTLLLEVVELAGSRNKPWPLARLIPAIAKLVAGTLQDLPSPAIAAWSAIPDDLSRLPAITDDLKGAVDVTALLLSLGRSTLVPFLMSYISTPVSNKGNKDADDRYLSAVFALTSCMQPGTLEVFVRRLSNELSKGTSANGTGRSLRLLRELLVRLPKNNGESTNRLHKIICHAALRIILRFPDVVTNPIFTSFWEPELDSRGYGARLRLVRLKTRLKEENRPAFEEVAKLCAEAITSARKVPEPSAADQTGFGLSPGETEPPLEESILNILDDTGYIKEPKILLDFQGLLRAHLIQMKTDPLPTETAMVTVMIHGQKPMSARAGYADALAASLEPELERQHALMSIVIPSVSTDRQASYAGKVRNLQALGGGKGVLKSTLEGVRDTLIRQPKE